MRPLTVLAAVLGIVAALLGGLLMLIGLSGLEADYIYVGTILGRDKQDPKISTTLAGTVCLALGLALIAVALARRRRQT